MGQILFLILDTAIAGVFLIPLFWYWNRLRFHDWKMAAGYCLFALYLCAMFSVVGLPDIRYIRFDLNCNLTPFAYMFSDLRSTVLNVILFLPLGFFLPVFWKRFHSTGRSVWFGFCVSLMIEILQIFTFRASDVNDLMTNTLGTFLGWCIGRLAVHCIPAIHPREKNGGLRIIYGSALTVMVFFHPFLESWVYSFIP